MKLTLTFATPPALAFVDTFCLCIFPFKAAIPPDKDAPARQTARRSAKVLCAITVRVSFAMKAICQTTYLRKYTWTPDEDRAITALLFAYARRHLQTQLQTAVTLPQHQLITIYSFEPNPITQINIKPRRIDRVLDIDAPQLQTIASDNLRSPVISSKPSLDVAPDKLALLQRLRRPLTQRQLQVAKLYIEGKQGHQIASLLGIHPTTVSKYRSRIFYKLSSQLPRDLNDNP